MVGIVGHEDEHAFEVVTLDDALHGLSLEDAGVAEGHAVTGFGIGRRLHGLTLSFRFELFTRRAIFFQAAEITTGLRARGRRTGFICVVVVGMVRI